MIGLPGIALYLAARELGFNTTVSAANLTDVWWAVPVLVLGAVVGVGVGAIVGRGVHGDAGVFAGKD